jgi:cardiolipin synthase A/B
MRFAERLPQGVQDPGFEDLLQRIDGSPVLGGNRVDLFFDGKSAFPAMLETIRSAEREVLFEFFIVRNDETGRLFQEELVAAVKRGVTVRVLADGLGAPMTPGSFWKEMKDQGVDVSLFHPLFILPWRHMHRDHRKILVIDREVAFIGGMNIGEEYGSPDPEKRSWRDTHARITGPAAWDLAVVFTEEWCYSGGSPCEIGPLPAEAAGAPGARVVILDSRPGRGHREWASTFAALAGAARRTLWITNAYFAPSLSIVRQLRRAARRGVDVRLLLSGNTDQPVVRSAGRSYYETLLESGVRIFEYQPTVLHAKTLVVDGFVSVIGSSNLDTRSFRNNSECNAVILDPATAAVMEKGFRNDLAQAEEIQIQSWQRRPIGARLADGMARMLTPVL